MENFWLINFEIDNYFGLTVFWSVNWVFKRTKSIYKEINWFYYWSVSIVILNNQTFKLTKLSKWIRQPFSYTFYLFILNKINQSVWILAVPCAAWIKCWINLVPYHWIYKRASSATNFINNSPSFSFPCNQRIFG